MTDIDILAFATMFNSIAIGVIVIRALISKSRR